MARVKDLHRRAGSEGVTRRTVLRRTALSAAGGAFALAALGRHGAGQDKMPKEQAGYQNSPRGDERCGNCAHFLPPNACRLVAGEISPQGWCRLWAAPR